MKQKIHQPKEAEPACPVCGNSNAMLNNRTDFVTEPEFQYGLKCRDCGFEIEAGTFELEYREID